MGLEGIRSIAIAVVLSTAACTSAPPPPGPAALDESTLATVLTGQTLLRCGWNWFSRWYYRANHRADGTMTGVVLAGNPPKTAQSAKGTWSVRPDGLYCRTWQNDWGGGKPSCFRVSRAGGQLTFVHAEGAAGDAGVYTYSINGVCP